MSMIKNIALAEEGLKKINWVADFMPVLNTLKQKFEKEQPFKGLRITTSVHLEAKTAYMNLILKAGGAEVYVTGSNPLSTQDDICAALVSLGFEVYAWHNATEDEYKMHLTKALSNCPHIIVDDGGDLVALLSSELKEYAKNLLGGSEQTTTGILRLKAREKEGSLKFPMMAANDAKCKHLFDNRYGTGQSVWDGIMRVTNNQISGSCVVVAGYGDCGRGVAQVAKGLGANVIVTEVDQYKAIEAVMDGFSVMTMDEACELGDYFVTVTGCFDVIGKRHFEKMKNNAFLSNAGHFDVEVNVKELYKISEQVTDRKNGIKGCRLKNGKTINLLGEGRLVNLACGSGHPIEIMDMSFGIQVLCAEYVAKNAKSLENKLYEVPSELDYMVASLKLLSKNIKIDKLTPKQEKYLTSSEH